MALKNLGGPEAEPSHDFCLRKVQFFWLSVFSFGFASFQHKSKKTKNRKKKQNFFLGGWWSGVGWLVLV